MLVSFDFVVPSVHSQYPRDAKTQIDLKSLHDNSCHLTGRMLLRRQAYETDIDAILRACAEHGAAVEIKCEPPTALSWTLGHLNPLALYEPGQP